ncbi:MAG: CPBP family intramembrane metalloprotease [Candidatus Jettenia sp.]|uniref:CAAX prenyl protease 2/Lysostaphin resistance protein A-like domain-containing protein n=2 Tax=Candidatus Jettenia TaxID=360731 RepID=I3IQD1_9BACT|nr:MAG: CPBP family intramembrane metalloprotease [Candidatus Jettenia sp. AMX1]MBC6927971.1 CPBP family intramembrane metalloprotease [Candidatus Jettenia sp.]WKZ15240.1 MAG: CPBP family intramembrane metalloprotease [Candidatus Jettenia caeni]MCE7880978.1 CPBP family intramembrane metalloprotease [Candidatus Jettenia sp. AMX1]MDL1939231.1 CPBP family intramembrane metalloprotease [Candidatus Jettenia sp. AMX1]
MMNSFEGTKQYKKIFLLFLVILCVSSILAPFIKALLDSLVLFSPFVVDLLHYKQESYDFGKVMRRIMLAVAILMIFLFRKPLMISSFATIGIKHTQKWREQLQMGFLLGAGMLTLYIAFLYSAGTRILDIDAKSFGDLIFQLAKILLIAGLVGCIEELFFRGFILQSLLKDLPAILAVCITSIFYSSLHFLKVKLIVSPGIQPYVGFMVIYQFLKNFVVDFNTILPSMVGLFLVGVVLSYACLRTNSLYLSIGLHAGWVFLIKTNSLFFDHVHRNSNWLFGDSNVVTGVLGWVLLIITLIIIRFVTKMPHNTDITPYHI